MLGSLLEHIPHPSGEADVLESGLVELVEGEGVRTRFRGVHSSVSLVCIRQIPIEAQRAFRICASTIGLVIREIRGSSAASV